MTQDQWEHVRGSLNSLRLLMFAMAKLVPDQDRLREEFNRQKEMLEAFALNSGIRESALDLQRRKIDEVEKIVWG